MEQTCCLGLNVLQSDPRGLSFGRPLFSRLVYLGLFEAPSWSASFETCR